LYQIRWDENQQEGNALDQIRGKERDTVTMSRSDSISPTAPSMAHPAWSPKPILTLKSCLPVTEKGGEDEIREEREMREERMENGRVLERCKENMR
jgi:hypothetical protein